MMESKRITRRIVFIALLLVGVLAFAGAASAAILDVGPVGSGHTYTTISSAIDAAAPGDTIIVYDNSGAAYTYTESVNVNKTDINVTATGNVTVNSADPGSNTFSVNANNATLSGFTITGATGTGLAGIFINNSYSQCNILNNFITGNNYGIIVNGGTPNISNNIISDNAVDGIYLNDGEATITSNHLIDNIWDGIHVQGGSPTIHYNRIYGNDRFGLHMVSDGYADATYNWWGTNLPTINIALFNVDIYSVHGIINPHVNYIPYLVMRMTADSPIYWGDNSLVTVDFTRDTWGNLAPGTVPDGTPVTFTLWPIIQGSLSSNSATTYNGVATVIFTAASSGIPLLGQWVESECDNEDESAFINIGSRDSVYVNKTDDTGGLANVGQTVIYTITVRNTGGSSANNIALTDVLPSGVTFVSASNGGTYNSGTRTVSWPTFNVGAGNSRTRTITVTVNSVQAGQDVTNTAVARWFYNIYTRYSNADIFHVNKADVSLLKSGNTTGVVDVNQSVTYTISNFNNGPDTATNVVLSDVLPVGVTFESASDGGSYDSGTRTVTWDPFSINSGATVFRYIYVTVNSLQIGQNVINNATATHNKYPFYSTSNNYTFYVNYANVTINKTGNGPLNVTQTGIFTITLHNYGPNIAHNVVVTDSLPDGFSPLTPTKGYITQIGNVISWYVGNLTVDEEASLQLSGIITPAMALVGFVQNTATETQTEFNQELQIATGTILVNPMANVTITKTGNGPLNVGQTGTFNVTVTNTGPNIAHNVVVTDTAPAGFSDWTYPVGTTYEGTTWTIGTLNAGESRTLLISGLITVAMANSTIHNTATETQTEFTQEVQTASADIVVNPMANVTMTKTGNGPVNVGQVMTFNITITNNGPNNAENVIVTDIAPAGFTDWTVPVGTTYDGTTWNIGTLLAGETKTLLINGTATVAMAGTDITNNATETQSTFNPVPVTQQSATIHVKKSSVYVNVNPTIINTTVGSIVTITYKVGNKGPDSADNVVMTWVIPDGLEFVSASSPDWSQPTYDAATRTLTWNLSTVPVGDPELIVNFRVLRAGVFNIAPTIIASTYNGEDPIVVAQTIITAQAAGGNEVNAQTVGMQTTGLPIGILVLAILMVFSGILLPKRK